MTDLVIRRGDQTPYSLVVTFPAGFTDPQDLTAWTVALSAKQHFEDLDAAEVFRVEKPAGQSSGGGISVDAINLSKVHILISGSQTAGLDCPPPTNRQILVYDVKIALPGQDPYTVASGRLLVLADVSRTIP